MESSEKFFDTYGKNISFEDKPTEKIPEKREVSHANSKFSNIVLKYAAVTLTVLAIVTFLIVGGVFILLFIGLSIVGLLIRALFLKRTNSKTFFVIKK